MSPCRLAAALLRGRTKGTDACRPVRERRLGAMALLAAASRSRARPTRRQGAIARLRVPAPPGWRRRRAPRPRLDRRSDAAGAAPRRGTAAQSGAWPGAGAASSPGSTALRQAGPIVADWPYRAGAAAARRPIPRRGRRRPRRGQEAREAGLGGAQHGDLLLGGLEAAALLVDDLLGRLGDEGGVGELAADALGLLAELVERLAAAASRSAAMSMTSASGRQKVAPCTVSVTAPFGASAAVSKRSTRASLATMRAVALERLGLRGRQAELRPASTRAPAGTCICARTERISSISPITQFISASAAGSISSSP